MLAPVVRQRGLPVLPVDLGARVRAAFTTRAGGVSAGPWESLNLGSHVQDDPERVRANRDLVRTWAGAPVVFAHQVHGADVAVVRSATDRPGECDALVTTSTEVALGILVADCVPLLLADPVAGVVAAVHVGRAGLLAGVVPAALAALVESGADLARTSAVLGPSVCGECYEVPAVLQRDVAAAVPGVATTTSWGTPGLDIAAGVRSQLSGRVGRVAATGGCTMTDERLFSHRRDGRTGPTGRFAGVIRLLPFP